MIPKGIKKIATLCILKNGNDFLLLKRLKDPNKDNYTPVGGKLDPYETPLRAAIRETWEETGILVENMKYCGTLVETSSVDYNWISFVYMAEIEKISPPACNEGTLEWINFKDILKIPTPKTDWYIYKYLLDKKLFAFNAEYDEHLTLLWMRDELEDLVLV